MFDWDWVPEYGQNNFFSTWFYTEEVVTFADEAVCSGSVFANLRNGRVLGFNVTLDGDAEFVF